MRLFPKWPKVLCVMFKPSSHQQWRCPTWSCGQFGIKVDVFSQKKFDIQGEVQWWSKLIFHQFWKLSRGARGNEGERKSGPNLNQEYFFYFLRLQKFLFLSHPVSSPPKLLRINKAVLTAIVVQILQSWSLHELKVFFDVTVQRVQFNSLIIFLVEGVAGEQSDQCRSWRNSRWPWSGVNFTISLTHQIFSSASVPLWNHSHWRPRGGRARDMITNTHYHQELCVSHLTLTLIPSRL